MLSALISFLALVAGAILGITLTLRARKLEPIPEQPLDPITRVTNVLLIPGYLIVSPMMFFLAMVSEAYEEGILGVIGWIIAGVIWIAPFFFGTGLGLSVYLRKKGKGTQAFILQFAGFAAIALSFLLYAVFVGTLLTPLN